MALGHGTDQELVHGRDLERTVVVFVFPEHLPSDSSIQGTLSREETEPYLSHRMYLLISFRKLSPPQKMSTYCLPLGLRFCGGADFLKRINEYIR